MKHDNVIASMNMESLLILVFYEIPYLGNNMRQNFMWSLFG